MNRGSTLTPTLESPLPTEVFYPDSDGQPMAESTEQFDWIVTIKLGLEWLFANRPDVFVAGDLLWYPVEGDNKTRAAPDVMVAMGRPKGRRGSYMQWREGGVAPQVVFEIISPGNTFAEMQKKFQFYQRFGVEEYYLYDPERRHLEGWLRVGEELKEIENMDGWISPRLGSQFRLVQGILQLFGPDGRPLLNYLELARRWEQEHQRAEEEKQRAGEESRRAEEERQRAEEESRRAEQEKQRAEEERQRAERLAAQLRALGIDPQG
ncbi:MAG: Uma2 family endonuclease [Planctomycetes bacterium]|nr:Uma2 family endonuclease [Planctomycetota bacterium]